MQKVKQDPNFDWKQPITFYGKVIDQNEQSVANADVHFVWTDLSQNGTSEVDSKSDVRGDFSLTDKTGKRLSVTVSKDGYYTPKTEASSSFEYANPSGGLFVRNMANPVFFHLYKKGRPEDLIHGLKLFGINAEGAPLYPKFGRRKGK